MTSSFFALALLLAARAARASTPWTCASMPAIWVNEIAWADGTNPLHRAVELLSPVAARTRDSETFVTTVAADGTERTRCPLSACLKSRHGGGDPLLMCVGDETRSVGKRSEGVELMSCHLVSL